MSTSYQAADEHPLPWPGQCAEVSKRWDAVLGSASCPKGTHWAVKPLDLHAGWVLVLPKLLCFTTTVLHQCAWDINHCQVGRQRGMLQWGSLLPGESADVPGWHKLQLLTFNGRHVKKLPQQTRPAIILLNGARCVPGTSRTGTQDRPPLYTCCLGASLCPPSHTQSSV